MPGYEREMIPKLTEDLQRDLLRGIDWFERISPTETGSSSWDYLPVAKMKQI